MQPPATSESGAPREGTGATREWLEEREAFLRRARILLIDDEAAVVELFRRTLELAGYREIGSTTDSLAAIRRFEEFQPDLVLLDWHMRGMAGRKVLEALRAIIPAKVYLPILVVTSDVTIETHREALDRGATDVVSKPFDSTEFLARVGNLLETRFLHLQAWRESTRFLRATLDALAAHIAILDDQGKILEVNAAWERSAGENAFECTPPGAGANYLQACDLATGRFAEVAPLVAGGIRAVMARQSDKFQLEYPCHTPREERWFLVRVTRFAGDGPVRVVVAHENITPRRLAEERLRRSQSSLRMAGRLSQLGAWSISLPDLKVTWSDEVCALHDRPSGFAPSPEETLAHYPAEFREIATRTFAACAREGRPYDTELQVTTATGRHIWVRSLGEPVRSPEGRIIGVQGAIQDISGAKENEEKIRETARKLANTLESITDAFVTMDLNWCFTYINREAERLLQRGRSELMSRNVWAEFPEAVGSTFDREYHRAMQENQMVSFEEYYPPLAKWLEVRAYPSREGLAIYFRDVTEQRAAREALRASEERFRLLAMATNDAIRDWNLVTDAVAWNEGYERLFGYRPEEAEPTLNSWKDYLHPEEAKGVIEGLSLVLDLGGATWADEYRFRRRDGSYAWVLDRGHIIRDGAGKAIRMIGGMTDLTERHRAEEEQRGKTAFLEALVNSSLDGVLVVNSQGIKILQNQRFGELLKIPRHIAENRDDEQQLRWVAGTTRHPERFAERIQYLNTRPGETSRDDIELKDGTIFDRYSAPVTGRDGKYYGRIWMFRDTTVQRRTEEALRVQAHILDHIGQAVIATDLRGRITYANRFAGMLYGWAPEEMRGQDIRELTVPPATRAPTVETLAQLGRGESRSGELLARRRDGTEFPAAATHTPIQGPHGEIIGAIGISEDISARKQAEEALFQSRETLRGILDQIPQRVFWKNRDLVYAGCNQACAQEMGFGHPGEVVGKTDFDTRWNAVAELYRADDARVIELDLAKPSYEEPGISSEGEPRWLRTSKMPLHDSQGRVTGILGTSEDITEQKLAKLEIERLNADLEVRVARRTQELRAATEEAERANRAKSEFLSRVSHELRTPLNVILGFGELLETERDLGPEAQDRVERIVHAGRHLLTLVDEVLDISNAESGRLSFIPELVALDRLLEETLCLAQPLSATLGVELENAVLPGCAGRVLADPRRLKQVLLHLLTNAIKYNQPGGRVRVEYSRTGTAEHRRVRLSVKDNGPGLSAEQIFRLFTPFDRLDAERTRDHLSGTGLGLAFARRMVELMGGLMGVESTPGEGSDFWLELPLAPDPIAEPPRPEPLSLAPFPAYGPRVRTLLYVEDQPLHLRLMTRILARRPAISLRTAETAALGLKMAQILRPDLILLDLHLQESHEVQMQAQLRADPRTSGIPVVLVGGEDHPGEPLEARNVLRVIDRYLGSPAVPREQLR